MTISASTLNIQLEFTNNNSSLERKHEPTIFV